MNHISDAAVKRMAEAITALEFERSMARQLPSQIGEALIVKNTSIIFSMSVMAGQLGIREQILCHLRSYSHEFYKDMAIVFEAYDSYHKHELDKEMRGDPVDMTEANEVLKSILKK